MSKNSPELTREFENSDLSSIKVHIILSAGGLFQWSPTVRPDRLNHVSFKTAKTKWQPIFLLPEAGNIYFLRTYHQLLTHSDALGRRDVLLMGLKFLRKALKSDSRWSVARPLDVAQRYGNISARGQSFFKFCRLALHAISRYCRASLKMDALQILVRWLRPTLPDDGTYISIAQWHQTCWCSADLALVCDWSSNHGGFQN